MYICFVVEPCPSEKKYEFVNWDDDIPKMWRKHVQTTNQLFVISTYDKKENSAEYMYTCTYHVICVCVCANVYHELKHTEKKDMTACVANLYTLTYAYLCIYNEHVCICRSRTL